MNSFQALTNTHSPLNMTHMAPTVLILEDDRKIAALVEKNLSAAGMLCIVVHDGALAWKMLENNPPDIAVLDLMVPGIDGMELTRRIRKSMNIPILILSARSSEGDKVLGFEIGADDYVTKPFSTLELVARVRALLRRSSRDDQQETIRLGDLVIDPDLRDVFKENEPLGLTTLEFDLLFFMASRPGRVYTREGLMEFVWGDERVVDQRSIDSLISRLRRKIEPAPSAPVYIQTVWGAGYRFARGWE